MLLLLALQQPWEGLFDLPSLTHRGNMNCGGSCQSLQENLVTMPWRTTERAEVDVTKLVSSTEAAVHRGLHGCIWLFAERVHPASSEFASVNKGNWQLGHGLSFYKYHKRPLSKPRWRWRSSMLWQIWVPWCELCFTLMPVVQAGCTPVYFS